MRLHPIHVIIAGGILLGAGEVSLVPITSVSLSCDQAWEDALYDTPSGYLQPGYYVKGQGPTATSTVLATVIGTQRYERCTDGQSKWSCPIDVATYSQIHDQSGAMVSKSLNTYLTTGTKCE